MPDPSLTPSQDLCVKRALSGWGHAFAHLAEVAGVEMLHARMADGAIITWDEGTTSLSRSGEGANITLAQLDCEIRAATEAT